MQPKQYKNCGRRTTQAKQKKHSLLTQISYFIVHLQKKKKTIVASLSIFAPKPRFLDLNPGFDSNNEIKGTVDPVDLDRALLNSEGVRESDTIISISGAENFDSNSMDLRVNLFNVDNSSNSQVSIFLLAEIIIDKSQATNGITTHEDVAVGYLNMEIDTNFSTDDITSETNFNSRFTNISMTRNVNSFQINLDFPLGNEDIEDISIVVAHEKIVDGQRSTLGAVSLDLDNSQISNGINVVFPLIVICIISTVILFKDRFL